MARKTRESYKWQSWDLHEILIVFVSLCDTTLKGS